MQHDSYSDRYLSDILLSARNIALVGASANPDRASHAVLAFMKRQGYRMLPVNPGLAGQTVLDLPVYPSLRDIPEVLDMVDIFRASDAVSELVDEIIALPTRPRIIWMQLGVRHDEAARKAETAGIEVVMDRCPKIEIQRLNLRLPS